MGSIQDNHTGTSTLPRKIDTIRQIRTGKIAPAFGLPGESSAIFKIPHTSPVTVNIQGCEGDEHSYEPHRSPDNALLQYGFEHYKSWRDELPHNAHLLTAGAFGENLVSDHLSEETVCIGDIMQLGEEVLVQVTKPRQPCYKLNHRFQVKDMSLRSQNTRRTGWLYRVLKGGMLQPGDEMVLLERKYPEWTVAKVQEKLYRDIKDEDAMRELAYNIPELGEEIKTIFLNRLTKKLFNDDNLRLRGGTGDGIALKWSPYKLVSKVAETPRISSFKFEAISPVENLIGVEPGSHIRVKVVENERLVRAYSVVSGNSNSFELGIAYDEKSSRGGSKHMHEALKINDVLSFSEMKSDFPVNVTADRHILIAGGIGITAFIATAQSLHRQKADFHLYYAVRSTNDVSFTHYLDALKPNVTILNSSKGQRLDLADIFGKSNDHTHIYVCGGDRLMSGVTSAAKSLSIPSTNIHIEAFAASTSGDPFMVKLSKSKRTLEVKGEQTLLDVLRDAGLEIPSSCEVGNCGTCKVDVCGGRVEHRGTGLMEDEKGSSMLSCVSRGIGNIVLDL